MSCSWCEGPIPREARRDSIFCSKLCRQTAFRLRRRRVVLASATRRGRFAYADPPYPGLARRYYEGEASYAGEVDHAALIAELERGGFDGWALSTGAYALRELLPLCPPQARVCPWVKPHNPNPATFGLHNCWEALIVVGGRQLAPGKRDWLSALPARRGGTLPGRKPLAFCAFLFDCLGMVAGDELVDKFPGTGVVGRAWAEASRGCRGDASPLEQRRLPEPSRDVPSDGYASPAGVGDASAPGPDDGYPSPRALGDASREVLGDASTPAPGDASGGRQRRLRVSRPTATRREASGDGFVRAVRTGRVAR